MKTSTIISIVFVLLGLWALSRQLRESFVPEFLDQTMVKRTANLKNSSYDQQTNHLTPPVGPDIPVSGEVTPFRVNLYSARLG
jgi:hypothetical protein